MAYGTIKIDTITFTDGGIDKSVAISGLVQNPTFTGNITVTGTVSGNTVRGQTISGVTITGTTAQFTSGTFVSLTGTTLQGTTATYTTGSFTSLTGTTTSGTTANFVSGVFSTQISGVTVTGTTANFASGNFTSISGGTHTITSGVFAAGTAANPSISFTSDPNTGIYSPGADQVAISTNGTERMRMTNGGRIDFWGGSAVNTINCVTPSAAGTTYYLFYGGHSSSGVGDFGTQSFGVWSNGNVINTNNSYGAISDIKLKENIVDAASQWDDLKALQVRKYNFKEGQTHTQIGLIAQEVELVSPGLVTESPDRDKDGNDLGTVTKSVNYSVLYMKAVKALQEAMERIEVLEQRLTDAGIA